MEKSEIETIYRKYFMMSFSISGHFPKMKSGRGNHPGNIPEGNE